MGWEAPDGFRDGRLKGNSIGRLDVSQPLSHLVYGCVNHLLVCSKKFVDLMEPELEMIGTSLLPSLTKFMNNFRKSSESLSLFPMTSLHAVKGSQFWYTLSFLPITEQMTAVQCDLYSRKTDNVEHGLFSERLENLLRSAIQDLETDWKDG